MRGLQLACAAALVMGCTALKDTDELPRPREDGSVDEDGGRTDSGRRDGGGDDDSGTPSAAVGFGAGLAALTPADYSCLGALATPDDGGGLVSFDAIVTEFQGIPLAGVTVQFFPDNDPSADRSCTGTCSELVSDGGGTVSVSDNEGSWYAYRIPFQMNLNLIEVVQVNAVAPFPDMGSETFVGLSLSTFDTLASLLGVTPEGGTATIFGWVMDCAGMRIANAIVRLFDGDDEIVLGFTETGARELYFIGDGLVPSASQRMTHVDGLYGATNVPLPFDNLVRVEIWGTLSAGGAAELLGCEQVPLVEDGVTIVNVGPTRSDGPADCMP